MCERERETEKEEERIARTALLSSVLQYCVMTRTNVLSEQSSAQHNIKVRLVWTDLYPPTPDNR